MLGANGCWGGMSRVGFGSRGIGHWMRSMGRAVILGSLLVACGGSEPPEVAAPATLFDAQSSFVDMPEAEVQIPAVEAPIAPPEPKPRAAESDPYAYPAWRGVDLDCRDIGHKVRVDGPDPHRLDRDGNGWGCERF